MPMLLRVQPKGKLDTQGIIVPPPSSPNILVKSVYIYIYIYICTHTKLHLGSGSKFDMQQEARVL